MQKRNINDLRFLFIFSVVSIYESANPLQIFTLDYHAEKYIGENRTERCETELTISCIPFALLTSSSSCSRLPLSFLFTNSLPSSSSSFLLFLSDISSILISFFLPFDLALLSSTAVAIRTKIWRHFHHLESGKRSRCRSVNTLMKIKKEYHLKNYNNK